MGVVLPRAIPAWIRGKGKTRAPFGASSCISLERKEVDEGVKVVEVIEGTSLPRLDTLDTLDKLGLPRR
jgi:hypothetical protein